MNCLIAYCEDNIKTALSKAFPNFDIISFPTNFEKYTFTSATGCLLIKFSGASFEKQNTLWNSNQSSKVRFAIIAGYRGLNNYNEIFEPQQLLKNTLCGLEVLGKKLYLIDEQFLKEKNTDIYCSTTFEIELFQDDFNELIQ